MSDFGRTHDSCDWQNQIFFFLQSIVDIINEIGIGMFMDKFEKFEDFTSLKNAPVYKIVNQHLTQQKQSRYRKSLR